MPLLFTLAVAAFALLIVLTLVACLQDERRARAKAGAPSGPLAAEGAPPQTRRIPDASRPAAPDVVLRQAAMPLRRAMAGAPGDSRPAPGLPAILGLPEPDERKPRKADDAADVVMELRERIAALQIDHDALREEIRRLHAALDGLAPPWKGMPHPDILQARRA